MAKAKNKIKKKNEEVIDEPTLEDLEKEEQEASSDSSESQEEENPEEPETESLEARVKTEAKKTTQQDDAEGTFMSVDAAEQRNLIKSDLNLDTNAISIQSDEFICSICFLILNKVQLAKPRAKVCTDCC
jgi:hypothetical protein